MTDLSKEPDQIISIDKDTAIRYHVVSDGLDLRLLREEAESITAQLAEKPPSDKELMSVGRAMHPFYTRDMDALRTRLSYIENLLSQVKE